MHPSAFSGALSRGLPLHLMTKLKGGSYCLEGFSRPTGPDHHNGAIAENAT